MRSLESLVTAAIEELCFVSTDSPKVCRSAMVFPALVTPAYSGCSSSHLRNSRNVAMRAALLVCAAEIAFSDSSMSGVAGSSSGFGDERLP